ncbi:Holliday junction resolvase RecU [Spiroplasma endosymbiont of Amphibalanus improvisus]|uniref:Holliday junction resolvase RecU n=1 Tax=Spiroplasma endosymbiont of Amphibalanus improvisus TaxID=3066327 RepID=UPI00313B6117
MDLKNNKGMFLESLLNRTAEIYKDEKSCLFYKRHTPVVTNNNSKKFNYISKSECDYYGIYKSIYFEFEAKSTVKEKFNLQNLKPHQIEQLNNVYAHGGISFIIVYFEALDKYFMMHINSINNWILNNSSKQMPVQYFLKKGQEIKISYPLKLDFINYLISIN